MKNEIAKLEPSSLLSELSLAALLDVTPSTVKRLRMAGKIPFVRIGRLVRYDPAEVNRELRKKRKHKQSKCWVCGADARRVRFKNQEPLGWPAFIAVRQCTVCGGMRVTQKSPRNLRTSG